MENIIARAGRSFFAAGIIAIGVQQMISGDFRPVVLPSWPSWIPGHIIWVYAMAVVFVLAGVAILVRIRARQAALFLGCFFLALLLFFHIPFQLTHNLHFLGAWGNAFKTLAFCGGAFVVAGSLPPDNKTPAFARIFFSITMIVFGFEHFIYAPFVDMLIPSWIPAPRFWTYFCGAALMAAGIAIILKIKMRLAANLLGIAIFCWLIMLHFPRAFAALPSDDGNEWTSVFEALAFSGIAFVIAESASATELFFD